MQTNQSQDELLGDLIRWKDGSQQIILILFVENTFISENNVSYVPSLPAATGLAISCSDGWLQIQH